MKSLLAVILLAVFARGETPPRIAGRIRIEKPSGGAARFSPPEIVAWAGDQIHWYNDTGEAHEPGVIREDGAFVAFLEEPLSGRAISHVFSPMARIDKESKQIAFTIHYVCGRHRNEHGIIQVIPTP